ncbi:MAG: pseudouridine synthase, partial [Candidatus Binatia bacterium]
YAELKLWNIKADGKHAKSRFWVRRRDLDTSLIELEPVTGRTNQLRIHCASIGHPIVGDPERGGRQYERLCLHAYKLSFKHPLSGTTLEFEIPIPLCFNQANSIV